MAASSAFAFKMPLLVAAGWFITVTASILCVVAVIMGLPSWHDARVYVQQIALWQTWLSIAACIVLLMISRKRQAETEEKWAQGAMPVYVLGGLVTAILLTYGILPQWLVQPGAMLKTVQVVAIVVVHWICAFLALKALLKYRR